MSSSCSEEEEELDSYRKGGYHAVRVGDHFNGARYIAQRKLGWGHFSTVWLAFDTSTSQYVALKIQKSAPQFAQAALQEIEFLTAVSLNDPTNSKCVMHLIDHFKHVGPNGHHICMVLEFLGDSLLRLMSFSRYKPLGLHNVRLISRNILTALHYLHAHLSIIHCDLKPENILLLSTIDPAKDPVRSHLAPILDSSAAPAPAPSLNAIEKKLKRRAKRAVANISQRRASMGQPQPQSHESPRSLDGIDLRCKLVDFGNACWVDKQFGDEIQTRQYRAPEVILQCGYSYPVDIWSLGCTLFELATGDIMFSPNPGGQAFSEDEDHLALMMELLGKIPRKVAMGGARSKDFFDRHGDLKRIRRLKYSSLDKLLVDKYKFSESDAKEFAEFLCPILDFAPEKRPTALQCLQHPWLNQRGTAESEEAANVETLKVGMSNLEVKR